jgi:succinate dehydrogenase / fumarate reductase membrane anchor subunit
MGTGTELGRVRGLGAAKSGVEHWWHQRVTAVANLALLLWFVISLVRLPALDYATVVLWLRQPVAAIPMLLLIVSVFYHFRLGVQVVIEDYLHNEGTKLLALLMLNFYALGGAAAAVFAVLKIALGA